MDMGTKVMPDAHTRFGRVIATPASEYACGEAELLLAIDMVPIDLPVHVLHQVVLVTLHKTSETHEPIGCRPRLRRRTLFTTSVAYRCRCPVMAAAQRQTRGRPVRPNLRPIGRTRTMSGHRSRS